MVSFRLDKDLQCFNGKRKTKSESKKKQSKKQSKKKTSWKKNAIFLLSFSPLSLSLSLPLLLAHHVPVDGPGKGLGRGQDARGVPGSLPRRRPRRVAVEERPRRGRAGEVEAPPAEERGLLDLPGLVAAVVVLVEVGAGVPGGRPRRRRGGKQPARALASFAAAALLAPSFPSSVAGSGLQGLLPLPPAQLHLEAAPEGPDHDGVTAGRVGDEGGREQEVDVGAEPLRGGGLDVDDPGRRRRGPVSLLGGGGGYGCGASSAPGDVFLGAGGGREDSLDGEDLKGRARGFFFFFWKREKKRSVFFSSTFFSPLLCARQQ